MSYKNAGVDIDMGDALVEAIKPLAEATSRPGMLSGLGGFGAFFDPKAAGYQDPLLVAATDGVGTKLKIAIAADHHATIGIDLVAMCVNDLLVQGAEPLFFLDYFATGALDPKQARDVIGGIAEGCRQSGCALIGGETAEMPGMYAPKDYDLAGFAVGAVERGRQLTGTDIGVGDVVLGLRSDGLHSNGFSLVRKVVEQSNAVLSDTAPFDTSQSLAEALLKPTRLYVGSCLATVRQDLLKALAHITGGGLLENIPRVLPNGLGARLYAQSWTPAPIFFWLAREGRIAAEEMLRTFNCGIGMIAICDPQRAAAAKAALEAAGETVVALGQIEEGSGVIIEGLEERWQS